MVHLTYVQFIGALMVAAAVAFIGGFLIDSD